MKNQIKRTISLVTAVVCLAGSCSIPVSFAENTDNYQLKKMVIFSRHNMRAPTKSAGEVMASLSPHTWTDYTAPNGELTLLGGTQETAMGQYFRKYLTDKGLINEDWVPGENQVRFYANSYQRTIATAQYFLTGFLPVSNDDVEYHKEVGEMDSVFSPSVHFVNDAWLEQVQEEIDALADGTGIQGYLAQYADDIAVLENTLDYAESENAKETGATSISLEDSALTFTVGKEPEATTGLNNANSAADALIMQYYAEPDLSKADFGHNLTFEQWRSIGRVSSMYLYLRYGLPTVAVNLINPLVEELKSEMTNEDRVFSFLCGHDSDVIPLLTVLGVEDFSIEDNLCKYTPIGCKLVFEKYSGNDGEEYAKVSLVYQTSEKLRDNELVTLNDPPVWLELSLSGLEKNADGYYKWSDLVARFDEAIETYNTLEAAGEEAAEEEVAA